MKPQISKKTLVQLSLASTVVLLAVILLYLGFTGRPAPSRSGVANPPAGRAAPASPGPAARPPAAPSTPAARPASGSAGAPPAASTPLAASTPAGSKPAPGGQPPAARPGQPAPSTKPGPAPSAPAATPGPPASTGPAPATATPTKPQDPEAAVVGSGPRGRNDPFSPLITAEAQRASPSAPTLPPPPGVGLPMPPGFAAPGGGPAAAPPSPGTGMRVTGIMGSRARVAIIEVDGKTHIVGAGERVGDAIVVSILPDKVIMKQHNVTFELGFGGEGSS